MKTLLRTFAFAAAALVLFSFLAGVASGLSGDPDGPHDVLLTFAFTGFFVAAFLPAERAAFGARLRRSTAVLVGGSTGALCLLVVTAIVRSLFSNGGGDPEALWHPSVVAAAKAGAFLLSASLARGVSSGILGTTGHPLSEAVGGNSVAADSEFRI